MLTNADVKARLVALLSSGPSPSNNFDPDHHLRCRASGTWWTALTVHGDAPTRRIHRSLHTQDVCEARQRRDELIDQLIDAGTLVVLHSRTRESK